MDDRGEERGGRSNARWRWWIQYNRGDWMVAREDVEMEEMKEEEGRRKNKKRKRDEREKGSGMEERR